MLFVCIDVEARAEHLHPAGVGLHDEGVSGVVADVEQRRAFESYLPRVAGEEGRVFDFGAGVEPYGGSVLQGQVDALSGGDYHTVGQLLPAAFAVGDEPPADADRQGDDGRDACRGARHAAQTHSGAALRGSGNGGEEQQGVEHGAFAVERAAVLLVRIEPFHEPALLVGAGLSSEKTVQNLFFHAFPSARFSGRSL